MIKILIDQFHQLDNTALGGKLSKRDFNKLIIQEIPCKAGQLEISQIDSK